MSPEHTSEVAVAREVALKSPGNGSSISILSKRSSSTSMIENDRHKLMTKYLYDRCFSKKWLQSFGQEEHIPEVSGLGVAIRRPDSSYSVYPPAIDSNFVSILENLGLKVGITMSSAFTEALLVHITPFQNEVILSGRVKIPIVKSFQSLLAGNEHVQPENYACLVREERILMLWATSAEGILTHSADVEDRLMSLIWGSDIGMAAPTSRVPSMIHSLPAVHSPMSVSSSASSISGKNLNEKFRIIQTAIEVEEAGDDRFDPKTESGEPAERPFLLLHAVVVALSMGLVVFVEMLCVGKLLVEFRYDGKLLRFALLATVPVFAMFSLFFFIVVGGSLFQLFGPLTNVRSNSTYYSAKAPKRERHPNYELPHITIQMPVYKEGLSSVIIPTIKSIFAAIKNYEEQGGTASIYVNDDGMQTISSELAEARRTFYELNEIGWCSRPADTSMISAPVDEGSSSGFFRSIFSRKGKKVKNPDGFVRKGQFKKASNMNYCLDFSIRVEDEFLRLMEARALSKGRSMEELTLDDEHELKEQALQTTIDNDDGRTMAGGDVRIGEIILLIDSDTRVPEDCLLYGALEMHESPSVGIVQHASGVMQVAHNAFENGITYFTNLIYMSIQFAVGNGDCAPFVGHNAFIRWKAVQSISWVDETENKGQGMRKFWSDDHVSEDFDISLRMQMNGFLVRLATYHDGGFKEGVSLTVYDELARWEKYAYGCNELVFNPIRLWHKGPFTKLFLKFLWSDTKITSKITILAYIGTYYAIAASIPLTLANYLIVGWFSDDIDQFYLKSWTIFVGMAVVFNLLSPIAFAMLRHRLGKKIFFWSLIESAKWTPMFVLFFGGISLHLSTALFCHFFSIKMEWTATAKELEKTGFRIGLDKIFRDFKWMYLFIIPLIGGMIYLGTSAPRGWTITDFAAIVPLANQIGCHALLPFALGLV